MGFKVTALPPTISFPANHLSTPNPTQHQSDIGGHQLSTHCCIRCASRTLETLETFTSPSVASFGSGVSSASTTAPANARAGGRKRNTSIAGLDSSPGSIDDFDGEDGADDRKRHPVKRACNECRQQKVSRQCARTERMLTGDSSDAMLSKTLSPSVLAAADSNSIARSSPTSNE